MGMEVGDVSSNSCYSVDGKDQVRLQSEWLSSQQGQTDVRGQEGGLACHWGLSSNRLALFYSLTRSPPVLQSFSSLPTFSLLIRRSQAETMARLSQALSNWELSIRLVDDTVSCVSVGYPLITMVGHLFWLPFQWIGRPGLVLNVLGILFESVAGFFMCGCIFYLTNGNKVASIFSTCRSRGMPLI